MDYAIPLVVALLFVVMFLSRMNRKKESPRGK